MAERKEGSFKSSLANSLAAKWIEDVRQSQANGKVDVLAAIVAAAIVQQSLVTVTSRELAPRGQAHVDQFHRDVLDALECVESLPNPEAS